MKASTVKGLGVATVLVAVGAIGATQCRASGTAAGSRDEALLPALEDRVNDVTRVEVETKDGPITFERDGEDWTLAEKSGYPANGDKIRELILALRSSRVVEQKTSNAARFGKLGLDAPDAEESNSKRVTLKDAKGETIATALVGNRRFGKGGMNQRPGQTRPEDQYYVHTGGDAPAVLATGKLNVDARAVGWVEQQFFDLSRDRVKAARVQHPNGDLVEVGRADMSDDELMVLAVPEGKEPKEPNGARPMLDALGRMRFDDVKSADEVDWSAGEITTSEFFTEHGIRVTVETIEVVDAEAEVPEGAEPPKKTWGRFKVDVAPDAMPEIPVVNEDPMIEVDMPTVAIDMDGDGQPEGEAGDPQPETTEPGSEEPEEAPPTLAELQREAAGLGASLEGWAYALPSWKTTGIRMPLENLVQDIPAPPEEEEPEEETTEELGSGDVTDDGAAEGDEGTSSNENDDGK